MSHIKIKDKYTYVPDSTVKTQVYNPVTQQLEIIKKPIELTELAGRQVQTPVTVDTDTYLLELAKSISPFMAVSSSGHTSFSTASFNPKNLIGEFTEILRKKDSTSCLANLLIQRLREIIKNTHDIDYEQNLKLKDRLTRDTAKEDIVQYAVKLHENLKSKNNDVYNENLEEPSK